MLFSFLKMPGIFVIPLLAGDFLRGVGVGVLSDCHSRQANVTYSVPLLPQETFLTKEEISNP